MGSGINPDFLVLSQSIEQSKASLDQKIQETHGKIDGVKKVNLQKVELDLPQGEVKEPNPDDSYNVMDEAEADIFPNVPEYEDGEYEIFYPDSDQRRWLFTIKDGNFDGEVINFYPIDQIKRKCTFKDGQLMGVDSHYTSAGQLYMEMTHKDGKLEGVLSMYRAGRLAMETEMIAGKLGSYMKNYHDNGNLGVLIRYKDGKMDGVMETFSQDGHLQGTTCYVADLKQGPDIVYYENGAIQSEVNYIDDLQDGDSNDYYPNGLLMQTERFKKGVSVTHAKIYDHEGRLLSVE